MPETYSETNLAVKGLNEETNSIPRYHFHMSKQVMETVAELLRIKEIDQKELARVSGKSQSTVSKWRDGTHEPGKVAWDKLMRFAAADPRTAHLAHNYVMELLGKDSDQLLALLTAVGAGLKKTAS